MTDDSIRAAISHKNKRWIASTSVRYVNDRTQLPKQIYFAVYGTISKRKLNGRVSPFVISVTVRAVGQCDIQSERRRERYSLLRRLVPTIHTTK